MGQALRKENIAEPSDYVNRIHKDSEGWIARAETKGKRYSQWLYKFDELRVQPFDIENVYMTRNTFVAPYRRIEYLKELKRLYIDLDTYNTKFTNTQILMNLQENYFNKMIPTPNMIINSGRGLYLEWGINPVGSEFLAVWKNIEDYLCKVLEEFGADRKAIDPTRVLRVPGSINSKSNTVVEIISAYEYVYDLEEILEEYVEELEELKSKRTKRKSKCTKIQYIQRERSLYKARIDDLIKLCELRGYSLEGHREFILFLYRYYLCYFTEDVEKALEDTLELNNRFILPLGEEEARKATKSAEKEFLSENKKYNYTNASLIRELKITKCEQTYMSTIISRAEYQRRDREYQKNKYQENLKIDGKLTEKEKISQRRAKIKDLVLEGLKQKDIYSLLNISKRTCINDIKYLKEQGLI